MNSQEARNQRSVLESLVVDNQDLDRLEDLLGEFNLFEAIGATRQELRHSDFLRFLLDPCENHGLGDYFLKTLFKRALIGATRQGIGAIDIDVANLSDAVIERERLQIDVLVHSERSRMVLAIENKVDSAEHHDQLRRYARAVDREFPGYRKALIFLTPGGEDPSDPEAWLPMSYGVLMDTVSAVLMTKRSTLGMPVATTLEHYATLIRRHIVSESDIAELCRQIYRQHKDALDLIFEHRPDDQMELKGVLEEEVGKQAGYRLDHCTKTAVRFFPEVWDQDGREKAGEGWTPTRRVVLFELGNGPDYLRLKLVVGPVDKNDAGAVGFREAVFACTQKYRSDFPGGMGTLAPRFTTMFSKELVKRKDYAAPETVPEKAREALRRAFEHDIPKVVERLQEVFKSP